MLKSEQTRGEFRTFYFSENLRKRQVRNANSTQHLRYSQRISKILVKIKSAKRASELSSLT